MIKYKLNNIESIISAQIFGNIEAEFDRIITDSRNITNFNNTLFVAIKGVQHNGHDFIADLYDLGVKSFLISQSVEVANYPNACFAIVDNTITALQSLAAHKRQDFDIPIIAITGSNGKTTVKEWLYHLLNIDFNITRSPKSYNSQIGVPLSVWLLSSETQLGIFEAGISMPHEMQNLEPIIKPNVCILTNIGSAHQANFSNLTQKAEEKIHLAKSAEIIIYNADCDVSSNIIERNYPSKSKISWSEKNNGDINLLKLNHSNLYSEIELAYQNKTYKYRIPFTDKGSVQNSMICFCCLIALNQNINKNLLLRFRTLSGIKMRLETIDGIKNSIIINDSYNSDINSLEIALDYLNQKKANKESVLILSDIIQNSVNDKNLYLEIIKIVKDKNIDNFVGIGEHLSKYKTHFPESAVFYADTDSFISNFKYSDFTNKAILIKGARDFKFEKISSRLQSKKHDSVLETDLNLMRHNLQYFKTTLNKNTRLMVMVKAFSYGSGYREVAAFLQHSRVDYLAVAFADEGMELRENGIKTPIMVMNPNVQSLQTMISHNLEPEIYSIKLLKELVKELEDSSIDTFNIHVKFDTGMHRLGLLPDEIDEFCDIVKSVGKIKIKTVFTHLSASDRSDFDYFTRQQVTNFQIAYDKIVHKSGHKPMRHVLNSAGIIRFPEYHFEMVRLGIGLYGLTDGITSELIPVSQYKSVVSQIRKVKKNDSVSYNRSGILKEDSTIATIPVGYADGLDRRLGNGNWNFVINGKNYPTIGDICMDMCMINIGEEIISEGDEVIIFGPQNTIIEMANQLNTIAYEVITGISQRVKRIYYEE